MDESKVEITRQTITKRVSVAFQRRAIALGLRGKKRDVEAIAYFVGAAQAYQLIERQDLAEALTIFLAFDLTLRGYNAIERILA